MTSYYVNNQYNILDKNPKIAREKGKILGMIMNSTKSEELGNSFIISILQKFNKSKMGQEKKEDVLHF